MNVDLDDLVAEVADQDSVTELVQNDQNKEADEKCQAERFPAEKKCDDEEPPAQNNLRAEGPARSDSLTFKLHDSPPRVPKGEANLSEKTRPEDLRLLALGSPERVCVDEG